MPWLLLLIPVGFVGWLIRPSVYTVRRSRVISKDRASVFALVRDLRSWPRWSPWLLCEPDAEVTFTGEPTEVGGKYAWNGKIVGSGEIEHTAITDPSRLEFEIRFQQPFKSVAMVSFEFTEVPEGTEVSWMMTGRISTVFHRMIKGLVGADYDRGLVLLADIAETGAVRARMDFQGVVDRPQIHWIGFRRECSTREIDLSMKEAFSALERHLTEAGILASGPWMTIYERYNLTSNDCAYIAAAPVGQIQVPEEMTSGTIPPHRAYGVTHFGPYDHLPNPWAAAYQHIRALGLKARRSPAPYEIYVTAPGEVSESELCTEIFVPVND